MRLIDKAKDTKIALTVAILLTYVVTIVLLSVSVQGLNSEVSELEGTLVKVSSTQDNFQANFTETLFEEHLNLLENQKVNNELAQLKIELESLQVDSSAPSPDEIFSLVEDFRSKVARNDKAKVDSSNVDEKIKEWGEMLISQNFIDLKIKIEEQNVELDKAYDKYLASLPVAGPSGGYSYLTVPTERGSFGAYVIKLPMSGYRVKTVSAARGDCGDNCPTKTLAEYINENGAVAGINGSYFCPPDYATCGGKVNSFDYAFYDSNAGKWINKDARAWFDTGMFTFNGNSVDFHRESSEFGGGGVTGAISNYPSLVKDGQVRIKEDTLTSYQKDVRGTRGVFGIGGDNLYLAMITNATVIDAAYVSRALGMKHALNLDGGGSSALYINGGYVLGPGRGLPNAIVLVKN